MTDENRELVDSVLRQDFAAFIHRCFQTVVPGQTYLPNWHIEAIAHHLDCVRRGETRRLIITLPPRNLKSVCASVAFPAFVLGHDPSARIVCASYAQDLTAKHARDCRLVVESTWYKQLFPKTRLGSGKNAESEFETKAHGYRLGTSVGGTLTGRGGNLILIDDPMKPAERMSAVKRAAVSEWYDSTLASRLDSKTEGAIVIIMQRLHVDDLVGHLLEKDEAWTHLNLPAVADEDEEIPLGDGRFHSRKWGELLHPEREPQEVLDSLESSMGSENFSAQYQQAPIPAGGALIKGVWFRTYVLEPPPAPGERVVQSWDTATKAGPTNDYSVCTTWLIYGNDYYLLDVLRERLKYPDLLRKVLSHAKNFSAKTVLIEDAGTGTPLIQDLRRRRMRPIGIRPKGDKIVRLEAQSAVIEAGYVLLPETAPWLDDFRNEILAFPQGRHDDQVDSMSQFLAWAVRNRTVRKPRIYSLLS